MQFSMIFEGQLAYPTRANEQQVMRDIVDQAVLAEAMGFDRVWAVEHFRGQRFFTEAISRWYSGGPPPDPSSYDDGDGSDEVLRRRGEAVVAYLHQEKIEAGTELTGMFNPNHAYGAVDDAIAYVERLVDAGADEVMFLMQMGTVPQDAILESVTNLGREVLPRFR